MTRGQFNIQQRPAITAPKTVPSSKERFAYSVEWSIKFIYPIAFVIFNAAYWSYYLKNYNKETLFLQKEDE